MNWYHRRMQDSARTIIGRGLERLGDLAFYAGAYEAGLVVFIAHLTGVPLRLDAVSGVFLLTVAVYLLDRVKPVNAWFDPADAMAHPRRAALLRPHARTLRVVIMVLSIGAAVLLARVHPAMAGIVILAHAGVLAYGSLPKRPRIKDRFIIKNLAVAGSMTALAFIVAAPTSLWRVFDGAHGSLVNHGSQAIAACFCVLHVTADAMLCDLDDAASDRAHGTRTVPSLFGVTTTWLIAILVQVVALAMIVVAAGYDVVPRGEPVMMAAALVATTIALWIWSPPRVRDIVDAKLPAVVCVISVLMNR
jgi:4-hydroxybenzoate polyprenyltransferase